MVYLIMHDPLDPTLGMGVNLWQDVAGAFKVPHVFKVDGEQVNGLVQYGPEHTLPDTFVRVVAPSEADAIDLQDFEHPEDCVYVFGPDNTKKGWQDNFEGDKVTIRTPGNTQLYSYMAAAIVLGHREWSR